MEVRKLKKSEYHLWDELVEKSHHGTIFHNSGWIGLTSRLLKKEAAIYGCFEKGRLIGGASLYIYLDIMGLKVASSRTVMTPYGGMVISKIESTKLSNESGKVAENMEQFHLSLTDIIIFEIFTP